MKFLLTFSAVLFLTFLSCTKNDKTTSNSGKSIVSKSDSLNIYKIDSVKVQDSSKISQNLTLSVDAQALVFPNINNKPLLDSIYAPINVALQDYSAKSILEALNGTKEKFYRENTENTKDWKPDFAQVWEQNSEMKLFSKVNNFMIIKYSMDGFTGGAHGYYNEIYKVFDTQKNSTLQLSQVIKNPAEEIWSKILMNNFLKGDLEKSQAEMLLVKEIPLNNNFYFDGENLYFLYNQYEITAYAAGTVLIKVPFKEIKPLLTEEFKAALKL